MKFAVISDSHGFVDRVGLLAQRIRAMGIDTAVHLGDDYDDATVLKDAGLNLHRVPGVYSDYYLNPDIVNRPVIEIGGLKVMLTHSDSVHKNDLPEDGDPAEKALEEKPDLVLYGHTHLPAIEEKQGRLWVNPGHLKPEDKKGAPPSYAIVYTDSKPFKVMIYNFDNDQVLMEN